MPNPRVVQSGVSHYPLEEGQVVIRWRDGQTADEAARLAEMLERIGSAARGFADECELVPATQLYGRITSGEIQEATGATARLLRTMNDR